MFMAVGALLLTGMLSSVIFPVMAGYFLMTRGRRSKPFLALLGATVFAVGISMGTKVLLVPLVQSPVS